MTLPTSDTQSSGFMQRRPHPTPPTYSIPVRPQAGQLPFTPTPPPTRPAPGIFDKTTHEHAIDFATHSWDLATGGLKTLTAKRELPTRPDRRNADQVPQMQSMSRSYIFALITLSCVVLMLIGGGVVLFVMLQP